MVNYVWDLLCIIFFGCGCAVFWCVNFFFLLYDFNHVSFTWVRVGKTNVFLCYEKGVTIPLGLPFSILLIIFLFDSFWWLLLKWLLMSPLYYSHLFFITFYSIFSPLYWYSMGKVACVNYPKIVYYTYKAVWYPKHCVVIKHHNDLLFTVVY